MITIKKNNDFQYIYKSKSKYFGKYSLIYVVKNNLNYNRFGFVVSKKNGNAPIRNRIKRLFRESIRKNKTNFKQSFDIILISKKYTGENIANIKLKHIEEDILKNLKKAKVFL